MKWRRRNSRRTRQRGDDLAHNQPRVGAQFSARDDDQELIFEKPLSPAAASAASAAAASATTTAMPELVSDEIFTHAVPAVVAAQLI